MRMPPVVTNGTRIQPCPWILPTETRVQFRFPRSKKRRIRRKWAKDRRNWRYETEEVAYLIDGNLYVSEAVFEMIPGEVRS